MHPDGIQPAPAPAVFSWTDAPARDALQLIAEGVTAVAGFGIAAISLVRADGLLEVVAVAGDEDAIAGIWGMRTPVARLEQELTRADDWGLLRFMPHDRLEEGDTVGWVPDLVPLSGPDAWHPLDMLFAPLHDTNGAIRGSLIMDMPLSGRRPNEAQRVVLNTYAEQAGRAVLTALEREALAERVRLADAARTVVRTASAQLSLDRVLHESQEVLVEGFQAIGTWIQTFDVDDDHRGAIYASAGTEVVLTPELRAIAHSAARAAWESQLVHVVGRTHPPVLSEAEGEVVFTFLESLGIASVLFVPLGAGRECLGNLVLARGVDGPEWTAVENIAALDIGHDLGRAILNARTFEREHHLVEELRALDAYKTRLIATVSHELKNPLTAIAGRLEILESLPHEPFVVTSLAAMNRGTHRLGRIVDDLLLLAKVGDPDSPVVPAPVDLRRVVGEVVDLTEVMVAAKGLTLRVEAPGEPGEPVVALGDATELDRVVTNLVSNAVKYTPAGGSVVLTLDRVCTGQCAEILLVCADEGFGISKDDREQLFSEFFRSSNPAAIAQPGTGLGLAIVKRIVKRHHGRIEVDSELGVGSTFRVFLPAAG